MSQETAAPEVEATAPAAPATTNIAPAAPVAPVAPEPAPTPEPEKPKGKEKEEPIEFEQTGNARLDYALSFVARAGIDAEHPALVAAANGDFGLLKATLAEKGVAGWEQAVALGEEALGEIRKAETEKVEQVQQSVLQVAEAVGVDWEAAVSYAKETATEEEVAKINGLFADPFTAKIAALYITHAYKGGAAGDIPPAKSAVKENAAPVTGGQQGGTLSRAEFAAEAGKLHKKFGDSYNQTPEYKALAQRLQR